MGVQWNTSLVGEQCGDSVRMVNIDTFGTKLSNPLETTEDKAKDDSLLDDATIEVYPESKIEGLEPHNQWFFYPDFPDQKSLKAIVEMARFFPNHSIQEVSGLTVHIWKLIRTQPSAGSSGVIFWGLLK